MEPFKSLQRSLSKMTLNAEDNARAGHSAAETSKHYRPAPALSRKMTKSMSDQSRGRSNNGLHDQCPMPQSNTPGRPLEPQLTYSTGQTEALSHSSRHNSYEQATTTKPDIYEPPITRSTSRLSRTKSNSKLNVQAKAAHDAHIQRTLSRHLGNAALLTNTARNPNLNSCNSYALEGGKQVRFKETGELETTTHRQCDPKVKLPPKDAIPRKGSLKKPRKDLG